MSIILGIKAGDALPVDENYLRKLAQATERYAPDGTSVRANADIGMGFQPYHTHERSKLEVQPVIDALGNMLTMDGRLDNHEELRTALDLSGQVVTDSQIALAAFLRWGERCFARFTGDWALALWSNVDKTLFLARDHAGTRTLYYEIRKNEIVWATYLDTFFVERSPSDLDEVYAARYLSRQPIRDATPYKGIHAVTPAHYLRFRKETITSKRHWSCLAERHIRYRTDADYEEHFFWLFQQSVARRTGPGASVLAQLSGGMDSSSIVCMSDYIRNRQGAGAEDLLDTISYYDDSESNWDERPFFALVEARRRHRGIHIRTSFLENVSLSPDDLPYTTYFWPGGSRLHLEKERKLLEQISEKSYRIVLSGMGGDELLGGNPTPLPELADYMAAGRIVKFFQSSARWCLASREPLFKLLAGAVRSTLRQYAPNREASAIDAVPWLSDTLKDVLRRPEVSLSDRIARFSRRPSTLINEETWWLILETLPHRYPRHLYRFEYRYPYLDKDLVEFLFAIPRTQLLRPHRRRHLMRAALRNVVPGEILERKRKATISRGPLVLQDYAPSVISNLFKNSIGASLSLIDVSSLRRTSCEHPQRLDHHWWSQFMATVSYELWLRRLDCQGLHLVLTP